MQERPEFMEYIPVQMIYTTVASFTKEVNPRSAKRLLIFNGRLANRGLTSLVREATDSKVHGANMGPI